MSHWWVVSPQFDYTEPVLDDGSGPTYTTVDAVSVDAPNRREAIRLGVKAMTEWPGIARMDRINPFAGVRAEEAVCSHGVCMCDIKGCETTGDQSHNDYCETCLAAFEASA